jgi:hypothetical protein
MTDHAEELIAAITDLTMEAYHRKQVRVVIGDVAIEATTIHNQSIKLISDCETTSPEAVINTIEALHAHAKNLIGALEAAASRARMIQTARD